MGNGAGATDSVVVGTSTVAVASTFSDSFLMMLLFVMIDASTMMRGTLTTPASVMLSLVVVLIDFVGR